MPIRPLRCAHFALQNGATGLSRCKLEVLPQVAPEAINDLRPTAHAQGLPRWENMLTCLGIVRANPHCLAFDDLLLLLVNYIVMLGGSFLTMKVTFSCKWVVSWL